MNHCTVLSIPSVGMYGMQRCIYSMNYTAHANADTKLIKQSTFKDLMYVYTVNRLWKSAGLQMIPYMDTMLMMVLRASHLIVMS